MTLHAPGETFPTSIFHLPWAIKYPAPYARLIWIPGRTWDATKHTPASALVPQITIAKEISYYYPPHHEVSECLCFISSSFSQSPAMPWHILSSHLWSTEEEGLFHKRQRRRRNDRMCRIVEHDRLPCPAATHSPFQVSIFRILILSSWW